MRDDHSDKREFFDGTAGDADAWRMPAEDIRRLRALSADWGISPGAAVIEAGCGTGTLTGLLLELVGEDGRLLCFDISPRMLEEHAAAFPDPRIERVCCPAEELDVPAAQQEAVMCFRAFPHFTDRLKAVSYTHLRAHET